MRPPHYAKRLYSPNPSRLLVVCTGSDAWHRAQMATWFPGRKVVLPPSADPAAYIWDVAAGLDVMIAGCGDLGPINIVAKLGGLLLAAGALSVLYAPEHGKLVRIIAGREAG